MLRTVALLAALTVGAGAMELRSYRLSPAQWQFLSNTDTGDAGGDLFFGLWLRLLQPLSGGGGEFAVQAAHWDSYAVHVADVRAPFGEYRSCDAGCIRDAEAPTLCTPWDRSDLSGSWTCDECNSESCGAVGRMVYPSSGPCRKPGSDDCLRSQLIGKFAPVWYSFPAEGWCAADSGAAADAAAGGASCSWSERLPARRVVHASCVERKLAALAQTKLPLCFGGCGAPAQPPNYTSAGYVSAPCWTRCVLEALSGNATSAQAVEKIFRGAIESDCPALPPAASVRSKLKSDDLLAAAKPHVVFCLVDDLGWNTVYNNVDIKSPVINALAAQGVKLTSFYAYRYCSPTRASFCPGPPGALQCP
jgi:hypothetical protein